jgi:hypothetical protein
MNLSKIQIFLLGIVTGIVLSVIGVSGSIQVIDKQIDQFKNATKNFAAKQ